MNNKNEKIEQNLFGDGNGETESAAIVINASNTYDGIAAEYRFIELMYGRRNIDWKFKEQNLFLSGRVP